MGKANTSEERSKELLDHRERPLHESKLHGAAYALPFLVIALGIFFILGDVKFFARKVLTREHQDSFINIISAMQESPFGYFLIGIGLAVLVNVFFSQKRHVQMITSIRVVQEIGTWQREFHEVYLSEIKDIKIKRTLFDRLAYRGTILIICKDKKRNITMPGITEPAVFKEVLLQAIEKYGKRTVAKKSKAYG